MITTLRKIRGGASPTKYGGGQSRDIVRGGLVKKMTLYMFTIKHNGHVALQGIFYFFNRLFCIHSNLDCLKKERFPSDDEQAAL